MGCAQGALRHTFGQAGLVREVDLAALGRHAATSDDHDDLVALGERDPKSEKLVLSSQRTRPTAIAFQREFHQHRDGRTLHHYASMLMA